jgi:hypothetical protein
MANASLLLNTATGDLALDASGNSAVATSDAVAPAPNNLAQDAASGIQTYLGECIYDTTVGVDWRGRVLGVNPPPPIALLKELLVQAALESNDQIATATVFITSFSNREIQGQVQVIPVGGGPVLAANFSTTNPQGSG